jgi:membrane protease YdiL (CAAX protease family)
MGMTDPQPGGRTPGEPPANPYAPPANPYAPPANPYAPPQYPTQYPPSPPPPPEPVEHPLLYRGAPETLERAVAEGRPVKAAGWGFPDFLITLALWFFFSLVSALIAVVLFGDQELKLPASILVALTMPWIGLAGWPLLVSWWKGNGPIIDFGVTWRWMDLVWGLVYGLVALVLAAGIAWGTTAIFGEFDSAAGELASDMDSMVSLVAFGVLVGIGAPIVEELAFRGLLFGSLAKRGMPIWFTILVSGGIFSLFHFEPIRIPLLMSTGLVLAFARYQQRSLTVPIVAHMVNNIPAAIALVLMS